MKFVLIRVCVQILILRPTLAFSGDGSFELEDELAVNLQERSMNNDYKDLTTIFDPYWLANLWPQLKNGAHLLLDATCSEELTIFFESILEGQIWTLRAIDSIGQSKNGLLWGNTFWIGSKEQCDNLNHKYMNFMKVSPESYNSLINGEGHPPPYMMSFSVLQIMFNLTKISLSSSSNIHIGFCLPRSCGSVDIHHLIEFSMNTYQTLKISGTLPRSIKILNVRVLDGKYQIYEDTFFYTLCLIFVLILSLTLVGTIVETTDETIALIEEDDILKPKFRQLTKSDISDPIIIIQDSSKFSMNFSNNMTIANNTNDFAFGSPKKSMESIFTVDGLIQNKFSDGNVKNDNFFNMQKFSINIFNEQENIKRKNCNKRKLTSTLKKRKISTDNGAIFSDHRCKKQKYVLTDEEPTLVGKCIDDIKGAECFDGMKCIDKNSNLAGILMCFSLRKNVKKIFNTELSEDHLMPIHGIKVINLFWILFMQMLSVISKVSDNKVRVEKYIIQTVCHSTYAVDTLFVLSGVLTSYSFKQFMKYTSLEENLGFGTTFRSIYCYLESLIRRYLRYICPYVAIICLTEFLSRHFHTNNILEYPDLDHLTCPEYWWRNILHINTFYPFREMCFPVSWYMSTEMHFFTVAILLLILSTKYPKLTVMIVSIVLLATWSIGALITMRSPDHVFNSTNLQDIFEFLFDSPWSRVGPYITGLGAGWILSKTNCCIVVSKVTSCTMWIISISILAAIHYGLYYPHSTQSSSFSNILHYISVAYKVMGHTTWGLAVAWIILSCVTGYGGPVRKILSLRYFLPLSKLTFSTYLVYPLMLKIVFISAETVQHITSVILVVYFIGVFILSLAAALLISLLLESPMIALLEFSKPCEKASSGGNR